MKARNEEKAQLSRLVKIITIFPLLVFIQLLRNKKKRHALNFYRLSRISLITDDVSLAHFCFYYDLVQLNNKFDAHLADDEEEEKVLILQLIQRNFCHSHVLRECVCERVTAVC